MDFDALRPAREPAQGEAAVAPVVFLSAESPETLARWLLQERSRRGFGGASHEACEG